MRMKQDSVGSGDLSHMSLLLLLPPLHPHPFVDWPESMGQEAAPVQRLHVLAVESVCLASDLISTPDWAVDELPAPLFLFCEVRRNNTTPVSGLSWELHEIVYSSTQHCTWLAARPQLILVITAKIGAFISMMPHPTKIYISFLLLYNKLLQIQQLKQRSFMNSQLWVSSAGLVWLASLLTTRTQCVGRQPSHLESWLGKNPFPGSFRFLTQFSSLWL